MSEVGADILKYLSHRLETDEIFKKNELKARVVQGGIMAQSLMSKVVLGEKINGKKWNFGEELTKEVNKKVVFYLPGTAGQYRIDDETRMSGHQPAKAKDLPLLMYKFGQWLGEQMEVLKHQHGNDLAAALKIAASTHYGLTHILHPFTDGNGRTARTLVNGILMLSTPELRSYHIALQPVPLMRNISSDKQLNQDIHLGKEPKMDPYIKAIIEVEETGSLASLELYIANIWYKNLGDKIFETENRVGRLGRNRADKNLILARWKNWLQLQEYIVHLEKHLTLVEQNKSKKRYDMPHPIPDYFAIRNIKNA